MLKPQFFEVMFVLGCSLVGLGMSAPQGSFIEGRVKTSVHLVTLAHDHAVLQAAKLCNGLASVPYRILLGCRK